MIMGNCISDNSIMSQKKGGRYENYYDWKADCTIDMKPMMCGDYYIIKLAPQMVMMKFKIYRQNYSTTFELEESQQLARYKYIVEVLSDQVIIPMIAAVGLDTESSILQYRTHNICHTRMANSQYNKTWWITDNKLQLYRRSAMTPRWTITISDSQHWQVSI